MALYNPADNAAVTLIKYDYRKKYFGPMQRFWENLLDDKDENEEDVMGKPKRDKYSPWEILAYNDYVRGDGLARVKI
jgi:hypothetical protein